jgi:lipopolysaccharide biosynthesis regulator YciM
LVICYGCSSQKDNATNRGLQNLSARYNFIYNSNVLLANYQDQLAQQNSDNYDNFLAVYIAPAPIDYLSASSSAIDTKTLDEIAQKAQTIIAEKGLSNYVDEANLLLAKSNFYRGSYFTAAAYFDYTAKAYQKDCKIYLNAMTWKARSLIQLADDQGAIDALDTVQTFLDSVKNGKAESLATLAQMSIYQQNFKQAIAQLNLAVKESDVAQQKIRWSYILGQLYENGKQYENALESYAKVEHSNAPFVMYFNAKLSKIRINDFLSNQTSNRREQLLKLLKDDKNFDYTDQIYFEVAEDYFARQDFTQAEQYYQLSVRKSVQNTYQKGLSYLKLADLNFKNLGNYVNAKLYYDSAITTLPKTYNGYDAIEKKAQNLEYLTNRYQLIAKQDTLQMIARLPLQAREQKLAAMFAPKALPAAAPINPAVRTNTDLGSNRNDQNASSTFYFSNLSAIGKGFTDFKKRWGNRPLEDNWRQSVKSSAQLNQQNQVNGIGETATTTAVQSSPAEEIAAQIAAYSASLPLTDSQVTLSNQQIIDAYFDIAGFYQQVLNDQEEATKVYALLLERYPQNNHLEAIYYSLYLAYAKTDDQKSATYKNLVLTKYPASVYAKTILDPNFSAKQNALDLVLNQTYNGVFSSYTQKDFPSVITAVNDVNQRFPGNSLQAQYDYLKAIAIGRTQHVDSLMAAFDKILVQYPNDQLINPLVRDHLAYINANLASFKARKIALIDFDPLEPRFIAQNTDNPRQVVKQPVTPTPVTEEPKKLGTAGSTQNIGKPTSEIVPVVVPTKIVTGTKDSLSKAPVASIFNTNESNTYYYVINVSDMSLSVSSSRFGVGQFNRGNYSGSGLKHQLLELAEDQLIFVGNFNSLSEVKTYAEGITPQLPKIMKVPANTYQGFFISKENFDKITTRQTLLNYIEFFKTNY